MAIGNADFANKQKAGFAWYFNCADDWASAVKATLGI